MKMATRTRPRRRKSQEEPTRKVALGISSLMVPAAVAAYTLGGWRIASDLEIARNFVIARGLFSHWQVWIALGAGIHACAMSLSRYGRGREQRDEHTHH
jgi:hypothetical protein